ncbi:TrmH family RNA methyltransferase [Urechidicola croceus]|uniref:RNA methyltransferase n=1 Tax=Urechidicola croceus TaxID=1850246 RepID=A0A1D8PAN2_9FLAO|nr:RNA methyltransferase [Urechidicola croceus]AOW21644.1 RNA methyltransferase [Urechidicola croceus]
MLSKSQIKLITSLRQKKYRIQHNLFIAEGIKVVNELLNSNIKLETLYCTTDFLNDVLPNMVEIVTENELKKISGLKNPNQVLGLFKIPTENEINYSEFTLALDDINDPGNLGTIIRLCDWFGIHQIVCSRNTVDCFNSKVVQSTMGSLSRISINYTDLKSFLANSDLPIYAAIMDGDNVYKTKLEKNAILVMGNEANGISQEILDLITNSIAIPRFGDMQQTESLNVATATAILLSEFNRN